MAKEFSWYKIVFLATVFAMLWSCGGTPLKVTPVDKTDNPTELLHQLANSLQDARGNQVNLLSPTWYQKAWESYSKAKQGLENQAALADILQNIANSRAQLQEAEVVALRSRDQLSDAIQSRIAAKAANAQQFKADFADAEKDFLKLTRAIEDNDFKYARNRSKDVSKMYRDLELRAITAEAIGDARNLMQKATDLKIQKIAPKTYAQAQSALSQAELYIAQNRYSGEAIQQKASYAQFMGQRAIAIGEASRKVKDMEPEDVTLWIESMLSETTTQLQAQDRRNLPIEKQQAAIVAAISALKSETATISDKETTIQRLTERLTEVEGTSQKFKYDKEQLTAEKRFNELYIKVQAFFDSDEAEVYKQFDQLVIRLKGVQFPSGQSVLQPISYPLMAKVQKAIRTFGRPDVVIEGHTDSVGSNSANEMLSNNRAEAVKQYLVSNGTLPESKIIAIGHGSARPIASNETRYGRAQNRRIDLIIKPQIKTMNSDRQQDNQFDVP